MAIKFIFQAPKVKFLNQSISNKNYTIQFQIIDFTGKIWLTGVAIELDKTPIQDLKPIFHSMQGSSFHAYIDTDCYPVSGKSQSQENARVVEKPTTFKTEQENRTGLNQIEEIQLSVFPNPSNGTFRILFPEEKGAKFEIVSTLGSVIYENNVPLDSKFTHQLDKGVYIVRYYSCTGLNCSKQIII